MAKGRSQSNTAAVAAKLVESVVQQMGLTLWDVRFEKEGASWYLRYFIDREGGVTIQDCEDFSRAIDKLLDKGKRRVTLHIPYDKAGLLDVLFKDAKVESVEYGETIEVTAVCTPKILGRVSAFLWNG